MHQVYGMSLIQMAYHIYKLLQLDSMYHFNYKPCISSSTQHLAADRAELHTEGWRAPIRSSWCAFCVDCHLLGCPSRMEHDRLEIWGTSHWYSLYDYLWKAKTLQIHCSGINGYTDISRLFELHYWYINYKLCVVLQNWIDTGYIQA